MYKGYKRRSSTTSTRIGDGRKGLARSSKKDAESKEKDVARTHYDRPTGQIGLHLDVFSAKADSTQKFGSEHFFLMSLTDKLYDLFCENVPLDVIKGIFERRKLFDGVIIENFQKGTNIVISLGFHHIKALFDAHEAYKGGVIEQMLQGLLITPSVLEAVGAEDVKLRCTVYEDEYKVCQEEITTGQVKTKKLSEQENDKHMIHMVKEYQKTLTTEILYLRDELFKMEQCLGELIFIMKRSMPKSEPQIRTYKDFENLANRLKSKKDINQKPLLQYAKTLRMTEVLLEDILRNISDRLLQVHPDSESSHQHERKQYMQSVCLDMLDKLKPDYNLTDVKHPVWQDKILRREQKVFLGFVSLLPCAVDAVIDIDQNVDEYMSGFDIRI